MGNGLFIHGIRVYCINNKRSKLNGMKSPFIKGEMGTVLDAYTSLEYWNKGYEKIMKMILEGATVQGVSGAE